MSQQDEKQEEAKEPSETENTEDTSSSNTSNSPFRKEAQDRLSSPEQLDQLLKVIRPKGWLALLGVGIFLIALVFWSFYGSIPIEVTGKGIILTERGLFGITALQEGVVDSISVKVGQWVEADDVVATLSYQGEQKVLKAGQKGKIIELDVGIGDYVAQNSSIGYGQYPLETNQTLVCHAYFPVSEGEKIQKGMEGKIGFENIDPNTWGYLLSNVDFIAQYPASDKELFDILRNQELVSYVKQGVLSVINVQLKPIINKFTVSGYSWTTPTGPHEYIKSGSICEVRIIINERSPISYIFPLLYERKTSEIGPDPNKFPQNSGTKS
jgi:hypothetical protein